MDYSHLREKFKRYIDEMIKRSQPTSATVSLVIGDDIWLNPDDEESDYTQYGAKIHMKRTGPYEVAAGDKITVHRGRSPFGGFLSGFHRNSRDSNSLPRQLVEYLTAPSGSMSLTAGDGNITLTGSDMVYTDSGSNAYSMTDIGTDANAIHDNVAAEISAITEKTAPVGADLLLLEDSESSNAKKRTQIKNLPDLVAVGNCLKNGSFNQTDAEYISSAPQGWSLTGTPAVDDATDVPDGAFGNNLPGLVRSVQITGDDTEGIYQTIGETLAAQVYTLSGFVKASSGTWEIFVTGDVASTVTLNGTDSAWVSFELQFTANGAPAEIYVQLRCGANTSVVLFDDVMLVRGDVRARAYQAHRADYNPVVTTGSLSGSTVYPVNTALEYGTVNEASNPTTVTFPNGFGAAPVVTATVVGSVNGRYATIESVSASQFVVQVRDDAGSDQDETVHWIAIGPAPTSN